MGAFYLLQEDGSKILLEDGSGGAIILEAAGIPGPTINWQPGGAGHPVGRKKRRNSTEELYRSIEHALEVALGLVEEPAEVEAVAEAAAAPAWSEERFKEAVGRIRALSAPDERFVRLQSMLRAYEEAQERQRIQDDEEETWFLMA